MNIDQLAEALDVEPSLIETGLMTGVFKLDAAGNVQLTDKGAETLEGIMFDG